MTHIINIRKTLSALTALVALLVVATSCEHKELYMRQQQKQLVKVHFDWSYLQDGDEKPETMTLFFYSDADGEVYKYDVPTIDDDYVIEIYSGLYDLVSYSTDDPNIASRNTDDINEHDILAMELNKDVPSIYGENSGIDIINYDDEDGDHDMQVVTIIPEAMHSRYNVTVLNTQLVPNASTWKATLSGLTNSIKAADYSCSEHASESVIGMSLQRASNNTCTGQISTFGQMDNKDNSNVANKLLLTIYTSNKQVVYYLFDVTRQIDRARDPRHVDIVVDLADAEPLKPGDPDYPGGGDDNKEDEGGLNADVDEYGNEDIEVEA